MQTSKWLLPAGLAIAGLHAADARAARFHWGSALMPTSDLKLCYSSARSALINSGYLMIYSRPSEVGGLKNGADVVITCVDTRPKATAVVMVSGDSDPPVLHARDEVVREIVK